MARRLSPHNWTLILTFTVLALTAVMSACSISQAAPIPAVDSELSLKTAEETVVPQPELTKGKPDTEDEPAPLSEGSSDVDNAAEGDSIAEGGQPDAEVEGVANAEDPPEADDQSAESGELPVVNDPDDPALMTSPVYTIELGGDGITVPEEMKPGLVEIVVDNQDTVRQSAVIRRLNEDVSLEEFEAVFLEDPVATLPMTFAIGGPTLNAESSSYGFYYLDPGTYLAVDLWVDPPRFSTFVAKGTTVDTSEPTINVDVKLKEYAISMPESIQSGPQLWKFFNQGQFPHNVGIVQLPEGKSLDDVIAWMGEQSGPPPFEVHAFWNVMSPAATSRVLIDLPPGDYLALDFLPEFPSQGKTNVEQGMAHSFTVTE